MGLDVWELTCSFCLDYIFIYSRIGMMGIASLQISLFICLCVIVCLCVINDFHIFSIQYRDISFIHLPICLFRLHPFSASLPFYSLHSSSLIIFFLLISPTYCTYLFFFSPLFSSCLFHTSITSSHSPLPSVFLSFLLSSLCSLSPPSFHSLLPSTLTPHFIFE